MAFSYWNNAAQTGDYGADGNYSGSHPGVGDDLVYDGRSSAAVTGSLAHSIAELLGSVEIHRTNASIIGTSASSLQLSAGSVKMLGTGHLYFENGDTSDTDLIIVNAPSGGAHIGCSAALAGSSSTCATVTKANPGVVTDVAHGLSDGDQVYFTNMTEMTELNFTTHTVANKAADTFEISNTLGYGAAETTGGTWARVGIADVGIIRAVAGPLVLTSTMTGLDELHVGNSKVTIDSVNPIGAVHVYGAGDVTSLARILKLFHYGTGTFTQLLEGGAIPTMHLKPGAKVIYKAAGTIAAAYLDARAELDLSQSGTAMTVTELWRHPDAKFTRRDSMTLTNPEHGMG